MDARTPVDGKRSRLVQAAVLWYGLYQLVHVFVNVRGLWLLTQEQAIDFPAPPPPGGWSDQVLHFFTGMAAVDLGNALLALLFVYGYVRHRGWHRWLGTVTLTVSVYAALVFDYATWASGAWTSTNLPGYLLINVAFLPIVALFLWWARQGLRGADW